MSEECIQISDVANLKHLSRAAANIEAIISRRLLTEDGPSVCV